MRVSKDKDVLFYNAVNRDGEMGDAQIRGSNVSPPWLTGQYELGNDQTDGVVSWQECSHGAASSLHLCFSVCCLQYPSE